MLIFVADFFAVVEQQLKNAAEISLFWVGFLVWGLWRLQVASGKVWKCLGKSGNVWESLGK